VTFDGWRYLLDRRTCRDRSDQERLTQHLAAVAAAYFLSGQAEPLKKAEVEARSWHGRRMMPLLPGAAYPRLPSAYTTISFQCT
jgi:hypothetical protein